MSVLKMLLWLPFLSAAGCTTTKPYSAKGARPNLTVQIQMERELLQRELAELHIYEVRGKCEQFYHGYVSLEEGKSSVALPVGADLIVSFVRANLTWGHSSTNEDTIRFRPQPGQQYRLRLRERKGSREVLFTSAGGGEVAGSPLPKCEKVAYAQ